MTLIQQTEDEMAKTYHEIKNIQSYEDLTNVFTKNPENVRDWDILGLRAVIVNSKLTFQVVNEKEAPEGYQDLVNSMLVYQDTEEAVDALAVVRLINPWQVSPKQADGKYILLSGNTRFHIIGEMFAAVANDLTAEEAAIYQFAVDPVQYKIKGDYTTSDLITMQSTDNQSVKLSGSQTAKLISRCIEMIRNEAEDQSFFDTKEGKGVLKTRVENTLGISHETYNRVRSLYENVDPFIVGLYESRQIVNIKLALGMQAVLSNPTRYPIEGKERAKVLWLLLQQKSKQGELPTPKALQLVKEELDQNNEIVDNEPDELGESVGTTETGEETSKTEAEKSERLQTMERLRGLSKEDLNAETIQFVENLVSTLAEIDPGHYDQDDTIKIRLLAQDTMDRVKKMKTIAAKELAEAEKLAAKEAKAAEKEAAKVAAEAAKASEATA